MFSLFTPRVCESCGCELIAGEKTLCTLCLAGIAPTDLHRIANNPLRTRLPRTAPIATVGAMSFYTHDAPVATLIRRAKYDNRPDIAKRLAHIYARRLMADRALHDIDILQAVPMHWLKRLRRGFNQTEVIARAFSAESGLPIANSLRAIRGHKSQTTQTAIERAANINGIFALRNPEIISGKHVALIDDILTTGATLSEAISVIMQASPAHISVFTLAATPIC